MPPSSATISNLSAPRLRIPEGGVLHRQNLPFLLIISLFHTESEHAYEKDDFPPAGFCSLPVPGSLRRHRASDDILGNIHKVRDIRDYVDYVQRDFNDPPGLMFMCTAENCLTVDGNDRQIIYERAGERLVTVIFDDPSDNLDFVWQDSPRNLPDWSNLP